MSILNKAATKAYLLELANERRPGWAPTRVSPAAIDSLERSLRKIASRLIDQHPSVGKTICQAIVGQ